jgi:hypothetical protein
MAKRNGKIDKSKRPRQKVVDKRLTVDRDKPLPPTLPSHLKPYDTNNDGVLSPEERNAMRIAKEKERLRKNRDERMAEMKRENRRP